VSDEPQILKLRGELLELGSAVRQLKQAGLDSAVYDADGVRKKLSG
jgi:hypothetical protein